VLHFIVAAMFLIDEVGENTVSLVLVLSCLGHHQLAHLARKASAPRKPPKVEFFQGDLAISVSI
jgi:hypothetical protein